MSENLLSYTEIDTHGTMSVTATTITGNTIVATPTDPRLIKDFGAAFFSGNIELHFKFQAASSGGMSFLFSQFSNLDGAEAQNKTGGYALIGLWEYENNIYPVEDYAYTRYFGGAIANVAGPTPYWIKFTRNDTTDQIVCYVYSDEAETTLVGSNSLALHAKHDLRYFAPSSTLGETTTGAWSGTLSDFVITGVTSSGGGIWGDSICWGFLR